MSGKMSIDELRRKAEAAARELNEKYDLASKLDRGAKAAEEAVRKTADLASSVVDQAVREAEKIDKEHNVSGRLSDAARQAAAAARNAASAARDAYRDSGTAGAVDRAASEVKSQASRAFEEARKHYDSASDAVKRGTAAARLPASVLAAVQSARDWIRANPGKAAVVSLAFAAGARVGAAFSSLDVAVLGSGASGNWLFHSAIVPYGLGKLAEKYEAHLKRQEDLLREGDLDEAERDRIEFQRNVTRYVGAPLFGAFSVAAGAGLISEALSGQFVTGAPISLVLGRNPLLSGIWLFGNGLICIHCGYKFFMLALADQDDVMRVVDDINSLLPST